MSLENATAKYVIQIAQEGSAAPAVQELNNLKKAAESASEGTHTATGSLRELRETSALTRESTRILNEAMIMFGGEGLGEVAKGALLASEAMRGVRTAAMLTGASIAEVAGGALTALLPAILVSVEAWKTYKAGLAEAESETALFDQTVALVGRNYAALNEAFSKRLISPENFAMIDKLLAIGSESSLRDAQQRMMGLGISQNSISGFEKLQKLEDEMHRNTMDHFDAERSKAMQLYNERLAEITKLQGAGSLTTNEAANASQGAMAEYNSTMGNTQTAEQKKNYADKVKEIDDDLFAYENMQGKKRNLTVEEEVNYRIDAMYKAAQAEKVSNEDLTSYILQEERKRVAGAAQLQTEKVAALNAAVSMERQIGDLQSKLTEQALTGAQREDQAIAQRYDDEILQIQKLAKELQLTAAQQQQLANLAGAGYDKQRAAVDTLIGKLGEAKTQTEIFQQVGVQAAYSLSSGMAEAIVSFADGTKTAKQAFEEFAASFLQEIAKMILEAEIFKVVQGIAGSFGGGGGGDGSSVSEDEAANLAASGGIFPRMMADGGFAGMVNTATYFPRFNVIAGEAGGEMMAALARPTMRSIGGMDAVVGNAGNRRLAITNASDLENAGGAGGASGHIVIEMRGTPDFEARIVSSSVKNATAEVTRQMKRHSPMSAAVKGLTA